MTLSGASTPTKSTLLLFASWWRQPTKKQGQFWGDRYFEKHKREWRFQCRARPEPQEMATKPSTNGAPERGSIPRQGPEVGTHLARQRPPRHVAPFLLARVRWNGVGGMSIPFFIEGLGMFDLFLLPAFFSGRYSSVPTLSLAAGTALSPGLGLSALVLILDTWSVPKM